MLATAPPPPLQRRHGRKGTNMPAWMRAARSYRPHRRWHLAPAASGKHVVDGPGPAAAESLTCRLTADACMSIASVGVTGRWIDRTRADGRRCREQRMQVPAASAGSAKAAAAARGRARAELDWSIASNLRRLAALRYAAPPPSLGLHAMRIACMHAPPRARRA